MEIRDPLTHFPPEDVEVFGVLTTYLHILPNRLDLDPENETEEELLYGRAYYEMVIFSFALEFGIEVSKVFIGGWNLSVYALTLPSKSRFIVGLPGAWSLGPMLFRDSPEQSIFTVQCDEDLLTKPDWFQRGVHKFREALHARMEEINKHSGPEGSRKTLGEPIQPI